MDTDEEEIPMETVGEYLARPLPALNFNDRGESPAPPSERIAAEFLHPWIPFENDITTAFQGVDLSREVLQPGLLETVEYYVVGAKRSIFGRFIYNACEPVARALYRTDLRKVTFGDLGCIGHKGPLLSGVSIFLDDPKATDAHSLAVGVFQPFWNYPLEEYPVTSPLEIRRDLEHEIGMYF